MNETSALAQQLPTGLGVVYALILIFFLVILRFQSFRNKRKQTQLSAKVKLLENELKQWKLFPDVLKYIAYSNDLEQSLDIMAGQLLNTLDVSSCSYLLKTPRGILFKVKLNGSVSQGYIISSKEFLSKTYAELAGNIPSDFAVEEHINGGDVMELSGLTGFLKSTSVPIRIESDLVGVLGVFGSNSELSSPWVNSALAKAVEICASFSLTYRVNLIKERGKIESVLQSMDEGVLLIDNDYKISVINHTAEIFLNTLNARPGDISAVASLVGGALPVQEVVSTVMDSGEPKTVKRVFVDNRYLGFNFMPVKFGGDIIGVGVIIHNDSEEENLKNLREDFIAMVVHELRAPLTVIRGSADMIIQNRNKFTAQDIDLFLTQIKTSAWDLLKIVNDLLDSAKMESGKFTVTKSPCMLNDVIRQEVESYKNFTDSKNIDLVLDLSSDVSKVMADKEKILEVLMNLLSNAVKFTYQGDITHLTKRGFIKVGSRLQGDSVQVFVADNGPGIPNDVKKQLFNKFVQARESSISNESGTGLGLVISKGIVEAHGGKIWVEDNVPKGSVFIFTLPII